MKHSHLSFYVLLVLTLVLSALLSGPSAAMASETSAYETIVSETTEILSDDYYAVTTVVSEVSSTRSTIVKGHKNFKMYNSAGEILWTFTVYGTFSISTSGVTCTESSYTFDIQSSMWELKSASTYTSGNQAVGDATFIKKLLFLTVETRNCHVVLSCDSNANLS